MLKVLQTASLILLGLVSLDVLAAEMHVTYDGQETATLTPGMYAYGPAKLPHEAHCADGAACVLFIAFESPVDAMPMENAAE